jgi:hypothetical protein
VPIASGQLALELAGCPSGVAREDAEVGRLVRFDQAAQDLRAARDVDVAEDLVGVLRRVFGAENDEEDSRRDRPAGVDGIGRSGQAFELARQRGQIDVTRTIDHQSHGAVGPVVQQQYDRLGEVRILHLAASNEELPGRRSRLDRCDDARRNDTSRRQANEEEKQRAGT